MVDGQKALVALQRIASGKVDPPDHWFTPEEKVSYDFAKFSQKAFR